MAAAEDGVAAVAEEEVLLVLSLAVLAAVEVLLLMSLAELAADEGVLLLEVAGAVLLAVLDATSGSGGGGAATGEEP